MSLKYIYLFVGPSGSGKTTITHELAKRYGYVAIDSYTTRPPRFDGEPGHVFVTNEEFDNLGEMAAFTEYNGHRYGIPSSVVDESDLYVIDPYGILYFTEHYHGPKKPVIVQIECNSVVRANRMLERGDTLSDVNTRIKLDNDWFRRGNLYTPDLVIENSDLDKTVSLLHAVIECWETYGKEEDKINA